MTPSNRLLFTFCILNITMISHQSMMNSHQSMFSKRRSRVQLIVFAILLILGIVSSLSSSNLPESVKRSASSAPSSTLSDGSIQSRRDILAGASGLFIGSICVSPVKAEDDLSGSFKVLMTVQLDSTKSGEIEIEVLRSWAPLAAERFRKLVETGFYDDARFFRVLPGYVAQFGIASDPALNKEWIFCERNCQALPDEQRTQRNKKGTLTFASSGKNSRQTQIFINLSNNDGPPNFLDAQGFVPFARVTKGMDTVVAKLNSEYGLKESLSGGLAGSVNQGKAAYYGKEYLDTLFPKLSVIKSAKLI